ncbi:MAG: toll/interleukin-1 receptor domain-containing protein, partial [Thermoanaerobaculia bacterium]
MATIFISYAREDIDPARALMKKVEALGHGVWIDLDSLPAASRWRDEVAQA